MLYDNQQPADRWVSKWPPAEENAPPLFLGLIFRLTGTRKWPPYGGASLDEQVFRPLERTERFSMRFNGFLKFHLTFSLYSDFAEMN